jgi:trimethylamine--corrinoid protein Co-methyltransferase
LILSGEIAPQFRVLSDARCEELLQASLEVLERSGALVYNAEGRDLLARAGARVEDERAFIPAGIVRDALSAAPRCFTLWGRDGSHRIDVEQGRVHFGPGLTSTYFVDPLSGEKRRSRRGDPALTARVCDALPNMDFVMGLGLIDDVTLGLAPVHEFAEMVANTTKPIVTWAYSPQNLDDIHRIAVAVAGSDPALRECPFFAVFTAFTPPLKHTRDEVGNILWAAEHGIPVVYSGGPSLGLTAPVTGASAIAIYLAGMLSGLAMVELKQPGAPFATDWVPQPMDLRTAQLAYGAPEMSLLSAAASDMCRWLGLPFMGTAGASESKLLDEQAAVETTTQVLFSALSGAAMVHDAGFLEAANTGSLALVVMTDEIIDMVARMMRGVEVSADTIMLDLIEAVGPDGSFMAEPRSVSRCRQEIWLPSLMDRQSAQLWEASGSTTMAQRTGDKLRRIIETHAPTPLAQDTQREIAAIVEDVEARHGTKRAEALP